MFKNLFIYQIVCLITALFFSAEIALSQQLAFPTAEGFGA